MIKIMNLKIKKLMPILTKLNQEDFENISSFFKNDVLIKNIGSLLMLHMHWWCQRAAFDVEWERGHDLKYRLKH